MKSEEVFDFKLVFKPFLSFPALLWYFALVNTELFIDNNKCLLQINKETTINATKWNESTDS
jgi:hypothetical protein